MDPISISIMIAISVASAAASSAAQIMSMSSAMEQQNQMMREQELENSYKNLSQKNQTLDQMREALETNEAHMSATGMAANSGSFVAMNAETIEEGDKAMRNADVAESLNDYTLKIQQQARQRQAYAQAIGSLAGLGTSLMDSVTGFGLMYDKYGISHAKHIDSGYLSRASGVTGKTSNYIDGMFSKAALGGF